MKTDFKIAGWNSIHVTLLTLLFVFYTFINDRYSVIISGGLSFLLFWGINYRGLKKFTPLAGYANQVTLLRLILIIITGLFYTGLTELSLFIIGLSIFCLDGVDGWIARKLNQESEFGAYFDMETDAFYVCIFSIILFEKELAGYWIIIPGFLRYLYGAVILLIGKKSSEEIRTKYGPQIAGLFFSAILSPFILPEKYYLPFLVVSSILLAVSFFYSFVRLLKVRLH